MTVLKTTLCAAVVLSCAERATGSNNYPSEWWTPVVRDQAEAWEILPQDAQPGEVILSKRTPLGVLSNFSLTPFEFDGKRYQSLEGFWQALKYPESDSDERALFPGIVWTFKRSDVESMVAFEAKSAGDFASQNMKAMGINWVSYQGQQMTYRTQENGAHFDLIVRATRAKVLQNENVKLILLQTGNLILKPDHREAEPIPPAWKYYDILMDLRREMHQR